MNYRTIDANINRLREGLRVIEDILRYEYNSENIIRKIKFLRHEISIIDKTTFEKRIVFRDSKNDPGFNNVGQNEKKRENLKDILRANLLRSQEASRVLEELLKSENDDLSNSSKKIRYSIYEIEKEIFSTFTKKFDLSLYLITQSSMNPVPLHEIVEKAIKGGITMVQLREKDLPDKKILELGEKVHIICKQHGIPLIIDDRIDICLALDADGVHLGQEDINPEVARKILGENKIIGISAHTIQLVKKAQREPVDYIGFGAIFNTPTKKYKVNKPSCIPDILAISNLPVVFIGGINKDNIQELKAYGAKNFAVVSAIMKSSDPEKESKTLLSKIL